MLLIETRMNGKLVRQHWAAPCADKCEAGAKINEMKKCHTMDDGSYPWTHEVREINPDEMARVVQQEPSSIAAQKAEIEAWQAECRRIGKRK